MKRPFLKPRLEGVRFSEHTVPLEVLKDWAAFEELVLEVARSLYRDEHPDRKRSPRGFADNFSLHLSGVGNGSALAVIERVEFEAIVPGLPDIFDRARDLILETIAAASSSQPLPKRFPRDLLNYFDRFGRSLRAGEKVEFTQDGPLRAITYDSETRKRLVLSAADEYRLTTELRGWISEVDVEKLTYTLKTVIGERIQAAFAPELRETVIAGLKEFRRNKILVKGVAVFDTYDRLKKIEQTAHIEILDANDVPARLEELAVLRNGWLDGEGRAPSHEGIKWLIENWPKFYPDNLPDPSTYPTPDGDIHFEWTLIKWELSAEVNLSNQLANLAGVNMETGESFDREIDMKSGAGWAELAQMVQKYMPV